MGRIGLGGLLLMLLAFPASGQAADGPAATTATFTKVTEDRWIQAIEIKPGSRAHVHHVIAYTQPAGTDMKSENPLGRTNLGGTTPNKPGVVFVTNEPRGSTTSCRAGSIRLLGRS